MDDTWLLCSRSTKNTLMKTSILDPSQPNLLAFKNFRNLYNKLIRIRKNNYYQEHIEQNKSNLKKTWSLIYEVLNKKNVKRQISELIIDNVLTTDAKLIAEHFNTFFTTVAKKLLIKLTQCLTI